MVVRVLFVAFFGDQFLAGASFVFDRCRFDGHIGIWVGSGPASFRAPLCRMVFGFILFGLSAGASYHAALAYGMVVGEAEVMPEALLKH